MSETTMTLQQARKVLARAEKATPGPWKQSYFVPHDRYRHMSPEWVRKRREEETETIRGAGIVGTPGCNMVMRILGADRETRTFVAASRTDIPALVATLEAWGEVLRREDVHYDPCPWARCVLENGERLGCTCPWALGEETSDE